MSINAKNLIKLVLFGILPIGFVLMIVTTGYKYIPVQVTVGSCMKDYTSPLSYTERSSPMRQHVLRLDGADIVICYGSPSVRDRTIFGELVPYNELWRMGANEPTRFYTDHDLVLGEVVVPKGRYSLYAVPGPNSWEIFISESITHWGNDINTKVREQEIGSFEVKREYNPNRVEEFTITTERDHLVILWDNVRIRIPIENIES